MAANIPAKKNYHTSHYSKNQTNKEETEAKETKDNNKVHLEFPYDDLELLYQYTLKKMGINNPFK